MRRMRRFGLAAAALAFSCLTAAGQPAPPPPRPAALPTPPPAAAATGAVAARVNGQPIPETAVQRGLERVHPDKRGEARPAIIDVLVENVLIDQYLLQLPQYAVDKKDIEAKVEEARADVKRQGKDFAKMLEEIKLTEDDLREQIGAELRWNKYANDQAKDQKLKELFEADKELFDGTMVRASHILLTPPPADAKAVEAATAQLRAIKQQIEAQVAAGMAKLPAGADNLKREDTRRKLLEDAFADVAKEKSQCPSKEQGGDVNYFQRSGRMVEPFAKAAFALKTGQMSDVVQTRFGLHLILVTDRKQGPDLHFENVKDDVKDEFCDRLHESLVAQLKPKAKIEVVPPAKP